MADDNPPVIYRFKPAVVAPLVVSGAAAALAFQVSPWWLLAIPCAVFASIGSGPNLNLADGCVVYLLIAAGFVLAIFHRSSGEAIALGSFAGYLLSTVEKRLTAKPVSEEVDIRHKNSAGPGSTGDPQ